MKHVGGRRHFFLDRTWVDAADVAELIGVSKKTLRRMSERKEFPDILIASRNRWLVYESDLADWLSGRWASSIRADQEVKALALREAAKNPRCRVG